MTITRCCRTRILLVEDDEQLRDILVLVLEDAGFDITPAIDGVHALEILGQEEFDLILSDDEMPRMTGLDLCRKVKAKTPTLPFILFTGNPPLSNKHQGFEFIRKPTSTEDLVARIRQLI